MIKFSLRQLEYALAIERLGSVAAAAATMGVAQPSVSASLAKLEDQLGLQLFIRQHALGMKPTPVGSRFLREAGGLLKSADDLQKQSSDVNGTMSGELSIGCFGTLAPMFLPALIKAYGLENPMVRLNLSEGRQDDLIEGLRQGRFDAVLIYDVATPDDLVVQRLMTIAPHVLLPAQHPSAKKRRISLTSLRNEPFILLDIAPSRAYFTGLLQSQNLPSQPAYSSPSLELVRGLVGQGLGYSILITKPHADFSYDGKPLAIRPIIEDVEPGHIALVKLRAVKANRLSEHFSAFTETFFKKLGSGSAGRCAA
jgi:DNA-binding transcriptional LysR family regulator